MNSKATWLLLLLAIALSAFVIIVERPARELREQQSDTRLFKDLAFSNVTAVQIRPSGRFDIQAERTNDAWKLVRPIEYPANAEFIEALITNLSHLQWRTHITADELKDRADSQDEFGFSDPQFALKIGSGNSEQTLLVGKKSVMGNEVFVQFVGGDGLFLVGSEWMNLLPRRAEDWKDPAMLSPAILAATSIEVRSGSKGFKLDINPTNLLWRLARPIEARANHEKVVSLLTDLSFARIAAYVAEETQLDLEQFGLPVTPGATSQLELVFYQGTNFITGLQLGNALTNAPEYVFARHLERDAVFVVPREPFNTWMVPHTEFRDKRLTRFSTNRIDRVEVSGQDSFAVQRDGSGWIVSGDDAIKADEESMNDFLFALANVEVTFENDVVTDFAPFGLTNPIVEFSISGRLTNAITQQEEIVREQLRFGTNESERVYLRRNDESRVYSIHREEFSLMPRFKWQMADKQIWNFAPSNVVSVLIEQHGKSRKLLRTGENEWSIAPGSQGIINPFLVEEAVHRIGNLKAVFWTAQGEQPDDRYGFKKNDFRITFEVRRDGKTELLSLDFGDFSNFKMPYAATTLKGRRVVFEFPLPLYLEFIRRDLSIVPAPLPPQ